MKKQRITALFFLLCIPFLVFAFETTGYLRADKGIIYFKNFESHYRTRVNSQDHRIALPIARTSYYSVYLMVARLSELKADSSIGPNIEKYSNNGNIYRVTRRVIFDVLKLPSDAWERDKTTHILPSCFPSGYGNGSTTKMNLSPSNPDMPNSATSIIPMLPYMFYDSYDGDFTNDSHVQSFDERQSTIVFYGSALKPSGSSVSIEPFNNTWSKQASGNSTGSNDLPSYVTCLISFLPAALQQ